MNMKSKLLLAFLICSVFSNGQTKGDNLIVVGSQTFSNVCSKLLDAGYSIEKKDNDLQTVRTESRHFDKYWNADYIIDIRVKDSVALITAKTVGGLTGGQQAEYFTNKKGEFVEKSLFGYAFTLMNNFAKTLGGQITYKKQ